MSCGVSFVLLTWCIEKRGPVFVAAFIPVVQIIVSVMDFTVLHESLYLGRYTQIQSFRQTPIRSYIHDD
jgi:drug/metabolite transporter (DMT)-like permease